MLPARYTSGLRKLKIGEKVLHAKKEYKHKYKIRKQNKIRQQHLDKIVKVTGDKEGYYIMIQGPIQQVDVTTVNIDALNSVAPNYI